MGREVLPAGSYAGSQVFHCTSEKNCEASRSHHQPEAIFSTLVLAPVVWLGSTSTSLVQATREAVDEMEMATQLLEAPGAGTATQPVQAPGSVPDVQPSGEGDLSAASDSEGNQQSVNYLVCNLQYIFGILTIKSMYKWSHISVQHLTVRVTSKV